MPTVSVIIPTYNNAQYLGEAIESVLCQTFRDYEIIVVDDGSTDNTSEIASIYKDKINFIKQENKGPAAARNEGLTHANGKYIAFLDADDLFLPDKLKIQVEFLETHPDIDLVYSDGIKFKIDGKGHEANQLFSSTGEIVKNVSSWEEYVYQLMLRNLFPIHAALVKKSCIDDVGGFDDALLSAEDWDLWFRISEKYSFSYLDRLTVKYRMRQGSISFDNKNIYSNTEKLLTKITQSPKFQDAPSNTLQTFFFNYGVLALALGDGQNAKKRFMYSFNYGGKNIRIIATIILTFLFSSHAYVFFRIKRKLFGMRGLHLVDFT